MWSASATMRVMVRLNTPGVLSPKMSLQASGFRLIACKVMNTPAHLRAWNKAIVEGEGNGKGHSQCGACGSHRCSYREPLLT